MANVHSGKANKTKEKGAEEELENKFSSLHTRRESSGPTTAPTSS